MITLYCTSYLSTGAPLGLPLLAQGYNLETAVWLSLSAVPSGQPVFAIRIVIPQQSPSWRASHIHFPNRVFTLLNRSVVHTN